MEKQIIQYFLDRKYDSYKGHEIASILSELTKPKRKTLNVQYLSESDIEQLMTIIEAVEYSTGINFDDFNTHSRKNELVQARFLFMHFVRKEMKLPLSTIGRILQGRDHSTVIHAHNVVDNWMSNPTFYNREKKLIDDTRTYLEASLEGQE